MFRSAAAYTAEPRVERTTQRGGTEVWGGKPTVLFPSSELKTGA